LIMAVPPDQLMKLMAGQKDKATPGGLPPPADNTMGMSDGATPPMGAPMSTPEPKMGNREASMINLGMAQDMLEQALPAIGSQTPEGEKIIAAIRAITGVIGPRKAKTGELQQSEILQLLQNLPQAGGMSPQMQAMNKAPLVPGLPPGGTQPLPPVGGPASTPPPPPPPGGAGGLPPPPGGGMPPPM
jgi:hypothetical protein